MLLAHEEFESAVPVLLEAWQRRPTRAEPLYELARGYRGRGDFALAHLFASRGLEIPYPADVLFVHRWVYEWGLRLERALAAGGLGKVDEAEADLRLLASDSDLPREIEDFVGRRLAGSFEGKKRASAVGRSGRAERLSSLAPGLRIGEIELDVRPSWPCFNPSIADDGDGFRMIVRTANYQIERGVLHSDGILQNLNFLVFLDADLAVTGIEPIIDRSVGVRRYDSRIQGYEDCRLVSVAGNWYATATVCDLNPVERREIALLELDGAEIRSVRALEGPVPGRHEKNWMPLVVDGALHVVYSCGPTVVLRCDPGSSVLRKVADSRAPIADGFRGGSQGLPVEGGYLFAVHEVDRSERALQYVHRLILLDDRLSLTAMSPRFTFTSDRVEFCGGIARCRDGIVLSFGVSDAAAGLAVVPLDEALGLLEPLPSLRASASVARNLKRRLSAGTRRRV
jgi:predicted GH43/DUF377 family glycosyl hydrolase